MRLLLQLALALALSLQQQPSLAQSAFQVRASEHPNYSRLVIPLAQNQEWNIAQDGRDVVLSLSGVSVNYDTNGVFSRIPRTRLLSVRASAGIDGTSLSLTLACDCSVETNRIGSRFLAVDIKRSEAGKRSRTVLTESREPSSIAAATRRSELRQPAAPVLPETPENEAQDLPPTLLMEQDRIAEKHDPAGVVAPSEIELEIEQARQRLLSQLAFATDEGLLTTETTSEPSESESAQSDTTQITLKERVAGVDIAEFQLRLKTALDRVTTSDDAPDHEVSSEPAIICPRGAEYDLSLWLERQDPAVQISHLRRSVVTNAGTENPQQALRLARTYLALGFSFEARAVLKAFGLQGREADIVRDLSLVFDDRVVTADGPISKAQGCPGAVAVWQALAGLDGAALDGDDGHAFVEGFKQLPAAVRHLISGRLTGVLEGRNRSDLVRDLFTVIDRTPGTDQTDLTLMRTILDRHEGKEDTAETLAQLSKPDIPVAHKALQLRIEQRLEAEQPVTLQDLEDLAIAERFHTNMPFGLDLLILRARAYGDRGDLETALSLLGEAIADNPSGKAMLREAILDHLKEAEPDKVGHGVFAEQALLHRDILAGDAAGEQVRIVLSETLIDLGLPNAGLYLLDGEARLPDATHDLTRARAALGSDRKAEIGNALGAVPGTEAAKLRAYKLAGEGEYDAAFAALVSLPKSDPQRSEYALLAGRWDDVDHTQLDEGAANLLSHLAGDPEAMLQADSDNTSVSVSEPIKEGETAPVSLQGARDVLSDAENLRALLKM